MMNLFVRKFQDGDEPAIIKLFNSVYDEYDGFVPRTPEYWHWCCLERPDVRKDGVLLAFKGEKLCGYLVMGFSGNIWEFCVADQAAARVLLDEAVRCLEKAGVSSVNINVPSHSGLTDILHEAGFDKFPGLQMFVTALDTRALVQALITPRKEVLTQRFNEVFGVQLCGVPLGACGEFSVGFHNRSMVVAEGFPTAPSVTVRLKFIDFLAILFGGSSVVRLLLTRRLRIKPLWKLRAVLKLLSTMRLKNTWFYPLSDVV